MRRDERRLRDRGREDPDRAEREQAGLQRERAPRAAEQEQDERDEGDDEGEAEAGGQDVARVEDVCGGGAG